MEAQHVSPFVHDTGEDHRDWLGWIRFRCGGCKRNGKARGREGWKCLPDGWTVRRGVPRCDDCS